MKRATHPASESMPPSTNGTGRGEASRRPTPTVHNAPAATERRAGPTRSSLSARRAHRANAATNRTPARVAQGRYLPTISDVCLKNSKAKYARKQAVPKERSMLA